MSDELDPVDVAVEESDKPKKKAKGKKPLSDFEIFRTLLQRTTDRKQAYMLKNIGEPSDVLFLCSANEKGFTYGSSELSIAMIEITNPDLKAITDGFLAKLHGLNTNRPFSGFILVRDQISELGKTKGEVIEGDIRSDDYGSAWSVRQDKNGREQVCMYAQSVESLFHLQLVAYYSKIYKPLLETNISEYVYYPYTYEDTATSSIIRLPAPPEGHPLAPLYPHGFRLLATKGLDVVLSKSIPENFPYPVISEEIIAFHEQGMACQFVHRVIGEGWRMLVARPNAVAFPPDSVALPSSGQHHL